MRIAPIHYRLGPSDTCLISSSIRDLVRSICADRSGSMALFTSTEDIFLPALDSGPLQCLSKMVLLQLLHAASLDICLEQLSSNLHRVQVEGISLRKTHCHRWACLCSYTCKKGPYNYGPIPLMQHSLCCGSFILHCLKKTSLKKLRNYLVEALPYTLYICADLGLIPFLCAFLTSFDAYKGVTLSVDKGTDNWLVRGTGIARRTMYSYTPNRRVFLGLFHYSLSLQSGYLQYPLS